jgi:hypothetical protein
MRRSVGLWKFTFMFALLLGHSARNRGRTRVVKNS